jgi:anti-sigma regulatory factor (Ser/Thr protein kinase)
VKLPATAPEDQTYIFTVSDSGIPFDPTQRPEVDITLPAEKRNIGGLGIHLVRQLIDKIHYRREEGKNVLTLVKKLKRN